MCCCHNPIRSFPDILTRYLGNFELFFPFVIVTMLLDPAQKNPKYKARVNISLLQVPFMLL